MWKRRDDELDEQSATIVDDNLKNDTIVENDSEERNASHNHEYGTINLSSQQFEGTRNTHMPTALTFVCPLSTPCSNCIRTVIATPAFSLHHFNSPTKQGKTQRLLGNTRGGAAKPAWSSKAFLSSPRLTHLEAWAEQDHRRKT